MGISSTPLLTEIIKGLKVDLMGTIDLLQPVAYQLLMWFFMFELVSGLLHSEPGVNPLKILMNKVKVWAYLYLMIFSFKKIMELIQEMFGYFAKVSMRGTENLPLEEIPYTILATGFNSLKTILNYIIFSEPKTWILLIGIVVGLFIFAKVCLSIGMVILEYLVMSSLVVILIPFMMFEKLRFVGDKVVGTLINLNMKIFVIQYLLYYFSKFLARPIDLPDTSVSTIMASSFYWVVAMAILGLMTAKGSEMAQTLISGATTFGDSSELVGMARKGISNLGTGIKGSVMAGNISTGATNGARKGATDGGLAGSLKGGGIGATVGSVLGGMKGGIKGAWEGYKGSK